MNSIFKYYELHSVTGLLFRFKLDLNPINGEYEPHIWHRHQIEPEDVVTAFLNISYTHYNKLHNRFESYSQTDNLFIWYNYFSSGGRDYSQTSKPDLPPSEDKTKIMIITAFKI